jgi:hypothetical protein
MRSVLLLLFLAVVSLMATAAASSCINDLVNRRHQRQSVKADLEVYEKLPAGDTKDELWATLEERVQDLTASEPHRPPRVTLTTAAVAFVVVAAAWTLLLVSGAYGFQRSPSGVLWVYIPAGNSAWSFDQWLSLVVLTYVVVWSVAVLFIRLNNRVKQQRPTPPSETDNGSNAVRHDSTGAGVHSRK